MAEEMDFSGLADIIGELLSSEEGQQQVQSVLSMLGGEKTEKPQPGIATGGINPDNIQMIMKLQQVMSLVNSSQNCKQTAFLNSLREILSPERRGRVDNAVKLFGTCKAIDAIRRIEGV